MKQTNQEIRRKKRNKPPHNNKFMLYLRKGKNYQRKFLLEQNDATTNRIPDE